MSNTPNLDAASARQKDKIQANTRNLDAAEAKQGESLKPSTPSLDAAKDRQGGSSGTDLRQDLADKESAKTKASEARSAESSARAQQNRDSRKLERGLKRAEITGRVNSFVRDWANQNAAVNRVVNSRGDVVRAVELPNIGMLDTATGELVRGPLFQAPTTSSSVPSAATTTTTCLGFQLYSVTVGTPPATSMQVWISAGVVGGELPSDFHPQNGKLIASGGSGEVYVRIVVNNDGEVTSRGITNSASTPPDSDTIFHYTLGYFTYVNNVPVMTGYGCGGVDLVVCRNWFAYEAPFYGVTLTRCGCEAQQ